VAEDAVALQRFFNEAKASGRVRSPSIVEILDLGQAEDGSPFLVFELLTGEGLDEWLRREGTIEPEQLVELFVGIVRALDSAHQQGIVHRDLKPANIYIHRTTHGGLVGKILDFGISKIFNTTQDLDGRADIWSVGVVMYEALTGTLPHQAPNYNALMVRILTQNCDPVMTRRTDLPQNLCAVVDSCLKRERDERTATAGILANQLEAVLREMRANRYRNQGGRRATDPQSIDETITLSLRAGSDSRSLARKKRGQRNAIMLIAAGIGLGVVLSALVILGMAWLR
jgi:serine/threonine-protein kinase